MIMKIGIIVHSHTGNTYSVAERLKERLMVTGHSLALERVRAFNDEQAKAGSIRLKEVPGISGYDALVFAAPVQGFSLSSVMKAYLTQVPTLKNKKVACFVTEFFPYPWMGGNRAILQMKSLCESKGAEICGTGVINWSSSQRNSMIAQLIERLSSSF